METLKKTRNRRHTYTVCWRYLGSRAGMTKNQLMCVEPWCKPYTSHDAALAAVEEWKIGRGVWGGLRRPPLWVAVIEVK